MQTLAQMQRRESRLASFTEIEAPPPRRLLKEFGPTRKSYHPEFLFWYLKNDDF
jgi:hypothetical protein